MLTLDHVRAYRRKDELHLRAIDAKQRARALELAASYVELARHAVGVERADVLEALATVDLEAREQKLADGLKKLVLDRAEFETEAAIDPVALRAEVFAAAAEARRSGSLDRDALVASHAERHGVTALELERLLYADLRQAQRMLAFAEAEPEAIVRAYELGQVQAVLLRAERVIATVQCADPSGYRQLFRALKFHRLLHRVAAIPASAAVATAEADDAAAPKRKSPKKAAKQKPANQPAPVGGYLLEIDGPASLFDGTTKYGLQLALAFTAIRACDVWAIDAHVRWGKDRTRLRFRAEGQRAHADASPPALPDEVAALLAKLEAPREGWRASVADAIFDVPGVGTLVPDLALERDDGAKVFVEVLGHWSRDAVWKRVEAAARGLPAPVLFCASSRLRVREEILPDDVPASLYVYKGVISARTVAERATMLANRA